MIQRIAKTAKGPIEYRLEGHGRTVVVLNGEHCNRAMVQQLTTLDINEVMARMSQDDLYFVRRMIEISQSGTGFVNDIEHQVNDLSSIAVPLLVMYTPMTNSSQLRMPSVLLWKFRHVNSMKYLPILI